MNSKNLTESTASSVKPRLDLLRAGLLELTDAVVQEAVAQSEHIAAALPKHRSSAENLAHYIGLRKRDIRELQLELAAVGLSSLGRCEGNVRDTLYRVGDWVTGGQTHRASDDDGLLDREKAVSLLHANTRALFGPRPTDRHVYIMVTAPDAAAVTCAFVDEILDAGADLLRINGAHESPSEWACMTEMFKLRSSAKGKAGRVFVDLPGPKMRAEIRRTQTCVIHFPRHKDRYGRTTSPTRIKLVAEYSGGAEIPIPINWLEEMRSGDEIDITDAGGRRRVLVVDNADKETLYGDCSLSLYVTAGLPITWSRDGALKGEGRIGQLPLEPGQIELAVGDAFVLNDTGVCGDTDLPVLALPEPWVLRQLQSGDRVILDDGSVVAMAEAVHADGWLCRVKKTLKGIARLRSGKGISFPDSELVEGSLGPEDDRALQFALEHADGVEVSFVNSADGVRRIGERIREFGKPGFGMILKLETRGAIRNLTSILFEALKYDPVGIMIARGDLAVELSFERLAELQEELLWFGEACHIPVVWATQVLDSVAHSGISTRAEVTDAAMATRAECIMLNKGPYVSTAVGMLADIIGKMEAHQFKKRSLYRPLSIATGRPW